MEIKAEQAQQENRIGSSLSCDKNIESSMTIFDRSESDEGHQGFTCRQVADWMNLIAPPTWAENWDRVGWMVGEPDMPCTGVMLSLNVSMATMQTAIKQHCNLIVSHHPMFFTPFTDVSSETREGRLAAFAWQNNLAVFSAHTNFDAAKGGLSDMLSEELGLVEMTHFPAQTTDEPAGIGRKGLLKDGMTLDAFLARIKEMLRTPVLRVIIPFKISGKSARNLVDESAPGTNKVPLVYDNSAAGNGSAGIKQNGKLLQEPVHTGIVQNGNGAVNTQGIWLQKSVQTVVTQNGAYDRSLLSALVENKPDVFVTGDVKYHDALDLAEAGVFTVDAGHFATEAFFTEKLALKMQSTFPELPVRVFAETDVYSYL